MLAGLDEILAENLQSHEDIAEATHGLHAFQEIAHLRLAGRQRHLSLLCPVGIVLSFGIGVDDGLVEALEELVGNLGELIVRQSRRSDGDALLDEVEEDEFDDHIVDGQHPFARGQLGELLDDFHVLDEVDVGAVGQDDLAALDLIAGVLQDVEVAAESEVLLVVGQEMDVDARVAPYGQGVLDVVAVERDGTVANGRCEGMLQHAHLVVVDVDIGEDVLRGGVDDVAGLEEVGDTHGALAGDNVLLVVGVATVDFLRHRLVDAGRENELSRLLALLDLIGQPGELLELRIGEHVGLDVVERQGELLVFRVLIVVTVVQIGLALVGNDLAHEFHRGIALTAIAPTLGTDGDLTERLHIGLEGHQQAMAVGADADAARLIAHAAERQFPSDVLGYGEIAAMVGHGGDFLTFILHGDKPDAVASLVVDDISGNHFLSVCG